MAENKEYLVQEQEGGKILISEEVVASIAALAVREIEGVYGLSTTANFDISNILGKKNLRKGIRVTFSETDEIEISCNLIVKIGSAVMDVAKKVRMIMTLYTEIALGMIMTQKVFRKPSVLRLI